MRSTRYFRSTDCCQGKNPLIGLPLNVLIAPLQFDWEPFLKRTVTLNTRQSDDFTEYIARRLDDTRGGSILEIVLSKVQSVLRSTTHLIKMATCHTNVSHFWHRLQASLLGCKGKRQGKRGKVAALKLSSPALLDLASELLHVRQHMPQHVLCVADCCASQSHGCRDRTARKHRHASVTSVNCDCCRGAV